MPNKSRHESSRLSATLKRAAIGVAAALVLTTGSFVPAQAAEAEPEGLNTMMCYWFPQLCNR